MNAQHFADVNAGNSNTQATLLVDNRNQRSYGLVVVGRVNTDRFVSADLDSDLTLIGCRCTFRCRNIRDQITLFIQRYDATF